MPAITACVCTHNRPDYLRDCLDGLANQTVGPDGFRILVVDSGSAPAPAAEIRALVAGIAHASLLRLDRPGLSAARNAAARAVEGGYIAYLDDDAIPAPDWIAAIRHAIHEAPAPPALLGGAIHPLWEAPLPHWWPARLRGVLSINDASCVAADIEPIGANMIVCVAALRAVDGFPEAMGRTGKNLLSDEEKILARRLRNRGRILIHDPRIMVHHQIQAERLTLRWLLARMYWQGLSHVRSARILGEIGALRREAPRRVLVACLFAPVLLLAGALIPADTPWLIGPRWRFAYARGFLRGFLAG